MCRLTLAIFLFLSIAGPTAAQAPTRQPVSPPPVLVEPHGSDEVSGRFDAAGGQLELKAEDGTLYVLVIPPRALMGPETIAMRSIRSVKGLPSKPKLVGGIDFAPKGLEFLRDATLTVTPKRPLPKGNVPMMWNFEGDGARPCGTLEHFQCALFQPRKPLVQDIGKNVDMPEPDILAMGLAATTSQVLNDRLISTLPMIGLRASGTQTRSDQIFLRKRRFSGRRAIGSAKHRGPIMWTTRHIKALKSNSF